MKTWVITFDTGRFGDWKVVRAADEDAARKTVSRARRPKILSIKPSLTREEWEATKTGPRKRRR